MSPVSEPQPGLIFGGILSRDARKRLTDILSELSDIQQGSSARMSLIATAGLSRYLNLDYSGAARGFAGMLVTEAEDVGIIEDQEGTYYALEILLNYLLDLEHLPPRHRPFFTSLITQYEQSRIQSRLDALQSVLRPDKGNIGNPQAVVQADIGRDARATDSESITFDFTKLLWFKYVVWIIVVLVPSLAAVVQLVELSPCFYFPFAGIFAFFGGVVMLTMSLIRHNQHRYSNWERGITFTVTILATVFFALLGLNSCADSPGPLQVSPTPSVFDYTVLVQEDEWPYEAIIGAYVELRLSPAQTGYTEDRGRVTLRVNAAYYGNTVVLDVTKSGFKPRSLEVNLIPDVEPKLIRLEKDQSAPTDSTPSTQASELNAAEQAEVTRPPSPQPSDTTSSTSSDPTPETINESSRIPPPTATIGPSIAPSFTYVIPTNTSIPPTEQPGVVITNTPIVESGPPTATAMPVGAGTPPPIPPTDRDGDDVPTSTSVVLLATPTPMAPGSSTPPPIPPGSNTPVPIAPGTATPGPISP